MVNFEKWFDFQSKALLSNSTIIREICYIREMYVDPSLLRNAKKMQTRPFDGWCTHKNPLGVLTVELMNSFSFVLAGDF